MADFFGAFERRFDIRSDSKDSRRSKFALYFLSLGTLTFLLYTPLLLYFRHWNFFAGCLAGAVFCLAGLSCLKKGHLKLATRLATGGAYIAIIWNTLWIGGVFSVGDLYLVPTFMVSWLVLGAREGLSLALLTALSSLALLGLHLAFGSFYSLPFPAGGLEHAMLSASFKVSLVLMIFGTIYFFHRFMTEALREAEVLNANMSAILSSDMSIATAIFDSSLSVVAGTVSTHFMHLFEAHSLGEVLQGMEGIDQGLLMDSIRTVWGEDPLTWELNHGRFTFLCTIRSRRHQVEMKPVFEAGRLTRLVLTAHDTEDLLRAQSELSQAAEASDILLAMVHLGPSRVIDFVQRSNILMADARRYMQAGDDRFLLIALHTIKGSARALSMASLSRIVHGCEERVRMKQAFDLEPCVRELQRIEDLAVKLGYTEDTLMASRRVARKAIMNETAREYLMELTQPSLETLVKSYKPDLEKLSKTLGKTIPSVFYDTPFERIFISDDAKFALDIALTHSLRNAMDHGFEMPDERLASGKGAPIITVDILERNGAILLKISDDGRGLDILKIKQKAKRLGRSISLDSPEHCANLLFESGFSTVETVSDISGRGVGMDAIREAMGAIGGEAHISFMGWDKMERYCRWSLDLMIPPVHVIRYLGSHCRLMF